MNKITKLIIGIITLIPFIYMIMFFLNLSTDTIDFDLMFKLHIGTMVIIVGLFIFYISNIYRTERIPNDKKTLWVVIIFIGQIIAMVIYWYLYIWTEPKENP